MIEEFRKDKYIAMEDVFFEEYNKEGWLYKFLNTHDIEAYQILYSIYQNVHIPINHDTAELIIQLIKEYVRVVTNIGDRVAFEDYVNTLTIVDYLFNIIEKLEDEQ